MKHKVTIEETLRLTVEVEAESPALAICQVEDDYNAELYVLTADRFAGADIFLSNDDEEVKAALKDPEFTAFVGECFKNMGCEISTDNKIKMAFGSMDNALYEFKEHKETLMREKEMFIYILYTCDAWHSHSSMTAIGTFSSLEMAAEFLRRNKRKFKLKTEEIEEFEMFQQTQGREENYHCERVSLDPLPEIEELPRKDDEFYDKEFVCGDSKLSRRELESLPCPFFTDDVTDEQMEAIVTETEEETRSRLRLNEREHIDFNNDRHDEIWWEEMEKAVNRRNVPYYEDMD